MVVCSTITARSQVIYIYSRVFRLLYLSSMSTELEQTRDFVRYCFISSLLSYSHVRQYDYEVNKFHGMHQAASFIFRSLYFEILFVILEIEDDT